MTFDLEKVRAAINSLLAEGWDNDAATVRELVAEIERLRADNAGLSKAVISIQEERDLAQAEFRAYHKAWEEQAIEIERLRAELASANVELLAAGELVTQLKRVREAEIDQAGAAERIYLEGVRAKDARIKELEAEDKRLQEFRDRVARILRQPTTDCDDLILLSLDARVRQLRAQAFRIQELEGRDETLLTCHKCGKKVDDVDPCPHLGEIRFGPGCPEGEYGIPEPSCAYFVCAECLKAEGKIGPDADECPYDLPPIGSPYRSWQITDERKEALDRVLNYMDYMYPKSSPYYHCALDVSVLRAMLEAGQ